MMSKTKLLLLFLLLLALPMAFAASCGPGMPACSVNVSTVVVTSASTTTTLGGGGGGGGGFPEVTTKNETLITTGAPPLSVTGGTQAFQISELIDDVKYLATAEGFEEKPLWSILLFGSMLFLIFLISRWVYLRVRDR